MQKLRRDLDIGYNIQQLRLSNKLTQDQVIARLNIIGIDTSKSSYAKIETNRLNIRVSELVALKKIFKAEYADFFVNLEYQGEDEQGTVSCHDS